MIYLLDTDLFIFLVRGLKPARRAAHRDRAQMLAKRCEHEKSAGNLVALSAISVSELEFEAQNSGDYEKEMAAVRKPWRHSMSTIMTRFIARLIMVAFGMN